LVSLQTQKKKRKIGGNSGLRQKGNDLVVMRKILEGFAILKPAFGETQLQSPEGFTH